MKAIKLLLLNRADYCKVSTEEINEAIVELEQIKFAITVHNENLRLNNELLKARDAELEALNSKDCNTCKFNTLGANYCLHLYTNQWRAKDDTSI